MGLELVAPDASVSSPSLEQGSSHLISGNIRTRGVALQLCVRNRLGGRTGRLVLGHQRIAEGPFDAPADGVGFLAVRTDRPLRPMVLEGRMEGRGRVAGGVHHRMVSHPDPIRVRTEGNEGRPAGGALSHLRRS